MWVVPGHTDYINAVAGITPTYVGSTRYGGYAYMEE